jgi:hypothetical protein
MWLVGNISNGTTALDGLAVDVVWGGGGLLAVAGAWPSSSPSRRLNPKTNAIVLAALEFEVKQINEYLGILSN